MPTCRERSRRQNAWRIESLEDRKLLSVMNPVAEVHTPTHHSKPAPKPVKITARFNGTAPIPSDLTQVSQITGSGKASGIGKFTVTVTPTSQGFSQGTFIISPASGGSINGTYSGSAIPTQKPSVYLVQLSGPILGGTKSFAGASGTFSGTANVNTTTGQASGTVTLDGYHI